MPELPDVLTFGRYLEWVALDRRISGVEIKDAGILEGVSPEELTRGLSGHRLKGVEARGKYLLVATDAGTTLLMHFGMSGFLSSSRDDVPARDHVRLRLDFEDGSSLAFHNQRRLGRIRLLEDPHAFLREKELGPNPVPEELSLAGFEEALAGRSAAVKAALMNQSILAGLGNVYSDEALFQADIDPRRRAGDLDQGELESLWSAIMRVVREAVDNEAAPDKFPADYLIRNRVDGAACPRCGGAIRRRRIAGRSAYHCTSHQK